MATRLCLFAFLSVIVFLWPTRVRVDAHRRLIVWNVGQGQWVTVIEGQTCWHFDAGGEHAPWAAIRRACGSRANLVTLSHWDLDHLSFVAKLGSRIRNTCLLMAPTGIANSRKLGAVSTLPPCKASIPFARWADPAALSENDRSRVIWWKNTLIPADSPRKLEARWMNRFKDLRLTKFLILGHHGSQNSTSVALLAHLPALQMAVASARRGKYGHPHERIRSELARAHVPLVTTEDWNSLYFDLD